MFPVSEIQVTLAVFDERQLDGILAVRRIPQHSQRRFV